MDLKLLVTRPRHSYQLQDLVPPSFFVHQNSLDYFEEPQSQPTTYQSFLVRKFNLKPVQEIIQSKPVLPQEGGGDQWDQEEEEEEEEEMMWWRETNLEEEPAAGSWTGSSDWLRHWIE